MFNPPHIALRCRDCGTWQRWVSKSRARAITDRRGKSGISAPETIRPDSTPTPDLTARVERLESEIKQISRELVFYHRIFGANRGPRKIQEFEREINADQVEAFGRAVGGER